ncbi:MAG: hypothetical protein ACRDD8_08250 [Bacteroidales bacterium]
MSIHRQYHITEITKGEYGKLSKVYEEYNELLDSSKQKIKVMCLIEISDLIGAIKGLYFNVIGEELTVDVNMSSPYDRLPTMFKSEHTILRHIATHINLLGRFTYSDIHFKKIVQVILINLKLLTRLYCSNISFEDVVAMTNKTESCYE